MSKPLIIGTAVLLTAAILKRPCRKWHQHHQANRQQKQQLHDLDTQIADKVQELHNLKAIRQTVAKQQ